MTKLCLRPEDAAPILGKSPSNIRRDMRRGVLDLGLVIPPEKSGKATWEFRIYPAKVEKIIGGEPGGVLCEAFPDRGD